MCIFNSEFFENSNPHISQEYSFCPMSCHTYLFKLEAYEKDVLHKNIVSNLCEFTFGTLNQRYMKLPLKKYFTRICITSSACFHVAYQR